MIHLCDYSSYLGDYFCYLNILLGLVVSDIVMRIFVLLKRLFMLFESYSRSDCVWYSYELNFITYKIISILHKYPRLYSKALIDYLAMLTAAFALIVIILLNGFLNVY